MEKPLTKVERQNIERDVDMLQQAGLCVEEGVEYHSFTNIDPHSDLVGTHEITGDIHHIGIRKDTLKDAHERRMALVQEHRHLLTGAGDMSSEFASRADADLVRLAEALYNKGGR